MSLKTKLDSMIIGVNDKDYSQHLHLVNSQKSLMPPGETPTCEKDIKE